MSTTQCPPAGETTSRRTTSANKHLTFLVDDQEYAVDILRVREIRRWERVTRVPQSPAAMRGVLNLRGAIVPIIDLRLRLGLTPIDYDKTTVIVVLQVELPDSTQRVMGIVVDAVSDVYDTNDEDIREIPETGNSESADYLQGMATRDDRMVLLLDVDRLLLGVAIDTTSENTLQSS